MFIFVLRRRCFFDIGVAEETQVQTIQNEHTTDKHIRRIATNSKIRDPDQLNNCRCTCKSNADRPLHQIQKHVPYNTNAHPNPNLIMSRFHGVLHPP